LVNILDERISDKRIVDLLKEIIFSFNSGRPNTGLPLGNLTSQLFSNVYLNEFDQFVKHKLKVRYYIRYADDFVIFSEEKNYLERQIPTIRDFLLNTLHLALCPDKIFIKTLSSGMDFLGWVHFFDHRVLRRVTRKKMFIKLYKNPKIEALNSYLGLLKHGNTKLVRNKMLKSHIENCDW